MDLLQSPVTGVLHAELHVHFHSASHYLQTFRQAFIGNCQQLFSLAFQARNAVERELREERFAREAVERRSADLERKLDALRTQLAQKEVC